MSTPTRNRLPAVDGLRVLAEYFVVRHHVVPGITGSGTSNRKNDPLGADIMSFFFVLTGFVTMYGSGHKDFSTWSKRKQFWVARLKRIYPLLLFNWVFEFARNMAQSILDPASMKPNNKCILSSVCPLLQLLLLDPWANCRLIYLINGVSWFITASTWLWLPFPFVKNYIIDFFSREPNLWRRIWYVAAVWTLAPILMWGFDMYTVMQFPPVRMGEFLVGCGIAMLVTNNEPYPDILANNRFMLPTLAWIGYLVLERTKHYMGFLCLHEEMVDQSCHAWRFGQEWIDNSPPCVLVFDKIVNKTAMTWAVLIYGISMADIQHSHHWSIRFLQCDTMQALSRMSMTLYLSHTNVAHTILHLCKIVLGWEPEHWKGDIIMLLTYAACFGLHVGAETLFPWLKPRGLHETYEASVESIPEDTCRFEGDTGYSETAALIAPVETPYSLPSPGNVLSPA